MHPSPAPALMVLIAREGQKRVVVAADPTARAQGIHSGMAATMAQALVSGLVVTDADPEADAAALSRLALWLLRRYAPVVAIDAPDGLMIDITGAAHLHGGEARMLGDMIERLAKVGISARAAVASTFGAAHALARFKAEAVTVAVADALAQLSGLPIAALRLPPVTIDGLRRLGFGSVGELATTPRAPLALRFGADVGRRLDQMFGRSSEPFDLLEAPEPIRIRRADRRARDHCPLHRQARRPALRRTRGTWPWSTQARPALPPGRRCRAGGPGGYGEAGARPEAPDPAAL